MQISGSSLDVIFSIIFYKESFMKNVPYKMLSMQYEIVFFVVSAFISIHVVCICQIMAYTIEQHTLTHGFPTLDGIIIKKNYIE